LMNDDSDGNPTVIRNYNKFASGINQFFPTMLKTKIGTSKTATSIYDYFTDEYKEKFSKIMIRSLKRDSLYSFSKCISKSEAVNGRDWILNNKNENFFIVQQKKESDIQHLILLVEDIKTLSLDENKHLSNIKELDDEKYTYYIRRFELNQKIFPSALQVFRLSLGQPAVNFPPLTARWIYENYTNHILKMNN